MQEKEPWMKVARRRLTTDHSPEQLKNEIDNCLHLCLQLTANLAILINPFLTKHSKENAAHDESG